MLLFLAAMLYVVASALTGANFTNARDDAPLLVLGIASLVSLVGWWRDRSRLREAERSERERLEGEPREREEALGEAEGRGSLQAERREAGPGKVPEDELRARLPGGETGARSCTARSCVSLERGVLGDPSDVPSMVLRLVRTLAGAENCLLLSKREGDGGGLD